MVTKTNINSMNERQYPSFTVPDLEPIRQISFVCVRFSNEFTHNLASSECITWPQNELIVVDNTQNLYFPNLGAALNSGIDRAQHDLVALIHEDVLLQDGWQQRFEQSLEELEERHPDWGLLGSVGWKNLDQTNVVGHWSDPNRPVPLNTFTNENYDQVARLDEQLLILKKSLGVKPDPQLPSIHEIGLDLALELRKKCLKTFVLNAPTIHKYADSAGNLVLSRRDSVKIRARSTFTFRAEHDLSRA
jgi:hypothetical protein